MANDLDEAEAAINSHNGLDNNDIGALLGRLVRMARASARRMATIESRLDALEATTVSQPTTAAPPATADAASVTDVQSADPAT